ncbi:hypothetical protein BD779DRAFT_109587 [Infundibulicybe gibba]|nr:hypothetical protein BD779DRAFT_109587 [Infundibulicybe gibba]
MTGGTTNCFALLGSRIFSLPSHFESTAMGNDQKYYRVPTTLVVDTRSRETFISFLDQPSPPTELQWIPQSGQTGTSPPSPTPMANARLVPAPLAPVQITSPIKGRTGGRQKDLVKCRGCPKKMTRAALPRHRTKSCPANARKRQYPCLLEGCDKSYTRSDALTRHLKRGKCSSRFLRRASTCSTSSSSSGYSGDPHAHFPVSPQSPHTPNSSGSLPSPNPPALEAVPIPPISTNPIADHGHTQLQFEPANPNLHANPNFYASHDPAFPVAVENYRYGLPLPQFLDQYPPLSFTPNYTSFAVHQGCDPHPRPIDLVSPAPPEDIPALQRGYQPHPAALMSQSRGDLNPSIPELLPDGGQFLPDIDMTHALPTSSGHWRWGQYDGPARQPTLAYGMQPTGQANRIEPKASEEASSEASPSAIFVPENHDLVQGRVIWRPPTPPGENYTINDRAMARFDALHTLRATSGFSEFRAVPIHEPDLELDSGSALEARISSNAGFSGTDSWTMLCPPSEYSPPEGPFEL